MKEIKNKISAVELIARHFVKELKAIFSDKGALLILIGAMIIYPVIYSIGYYNEVLTDLKVGLVDLDQSELSSKYISMLEATPELQVTNELHSLMEAEDLFMHNTIESVILIPKGFQEDVMKGLPVQVSVYADASYFLKYKNAYMAASIVNSYFSASVNIKKYLYEGKSFSQAVVANDPLPVYRNVLYNPSSGYATYIMPGMILIILQQTLLLGIGILGGSFSESKDSPFILSQEERTKEIIPYLMGKTGAYLLVSLINIVIAGILIHHWFSYPDKARIIDVLMITFPFVLAVTFLGIGLATLFKHRESAIVFMVFLSPIALFLSGLSWPASAMPEWLVALSNIFPSTTIVPAYLRLRTMGVGIEGVKHDILLLYLQAFIYGTLTIAYFFIRVHRNKIKKNTHIHF